MTPPPLFSDKSLDLWLGKPVPRYTSYPPATAFNTGVGTADYVKSLANLPPQEPVSFYVHIPFCRELCLYCGCNTTITKRSDRVERYLGSIKREFSLIAATSQTPRRVSHLHFGGGTPNIMTEHDIHDLFDHLRRSADFSDCREIAMELDPRTVSRNQVKALAECGITRVSLGVQDFNRDVQEIVQRIQPYDQVAQLCEWLRASGITRINFDLMYGLPLQTDKTVAETARQVLTLKPDRIALFSYAHVPQMKKHQQALEAHGLPDDRERLAMDVAAREVFKEAGYCEIGMDHFARADDALAEAQRAGKLHRNFQGYTDDTATTLLGFGASSVCQTPDGFFQNERDEVEYQSIIDKNQLTTRRGLLLNADDKLRAALIEEFMCSLSCDVEAICRKHGVDPSFFAPAYEKLAPYEEAGLLTRQGHILKLTSPYRMVVRVLCQAFDAYTAVSSVTASRAS